nr:reverse transcriptase domain-containing protein [Tanacetum cinerariifolium]
MINGVLYRKSFLEPWLRCVGPIQAAYVVKEIHEGWCSIHSGPRSLVEKAISAKVRNTTFHPGDFVYRNKEASHAKESRKLGPKWEQPYEVVEAIGKGSYKLRNESGDILSRKQNVKDLKIVIFKFPLMGLLDFVNSMDPFKMKVGERTLVENEVPLITETEDRVISPSPQTISRVDHTIQDELNVNVRKSPTALRRLIRQSGQAETCSGSAIPAVEDATSSSVTPTLERASKGDFCDNVRTRPPSGRFVVLSFSSVDTDIATSPQVVLLVSLAQADVTVLVTEPASVARNSSAPELEAGALSATPS